MGSTVVELSWVLRANSVGSTKLSSKTGEDNGLPIAQIHDLDASRSIRATNAFPQRAFTFPLSL